MLLCVSTVCVLHSFLYKNTFYKNIEAEIYEILTIFKNKPEAGILKRIILCINDKWNCDLDKVKIRGEVVSSQILGKRIFRVPPTGVEPMTFQNTGWNALTTEL